MREVEALVIVIPRVAQGCPAAKGSQRLPSTRAAGKLTNKAATRREARTNGR